MADLPDWLPTYFAERELMRADMRDGALAGLTPRERALVREFAVMGFVHGRMASRESELPSDSAILARVVDGMLSSAGEAFTVFRGIAGLEDDREALQGGEDG